MTSSSSKFFSNACFYMYRLHP